MEAAGTAPAGNPVRGRTPTRLLREPLWWAALAAFVGTALGVLGMFRQATLPDETFYLDPRSQLLADVCGALGESLTMLSALGVLCLVRGRLSRTGRRAALVGAALLGLLLAAEVLGIAASVYRNTGDRARGYVESPLSGLEAAALWGGTFLPCAVLLCLAVASFGGRQGRLGFALSGLALLAVPYAFVRVLASPPELGAEPATFFWLFALGWWPAGVSLVQAPLWTAFGVMLLRRARARAFGEAFLSRDKENLRAARRLYEKGLGRGDASVLDDLVSEDFRDLKRGSRGKPAMERVFSALWKSYPDLAISVEAQEAQDGLVRTRLLISGTDKGGVLWYPPTGKRVTFTALFVDRFRDSELVEHEGEADTEGLLGQLGLNASR